MYLLLPLCLLIWPVFLDDSVPQCYGIGLICERVLLKRRITSDYDKTLQVWPALKCHHKQELSLRLCYPTTSELRHCCLPWWSSSGWFAFTLLLAAQNCGVCCSRKTSKVSLNETLPLKPRLLSNKNLMRIGKNVRLNVTRAVHTVRNKADSGHIWAK